MGIADVIPGVSGGTIAFITGIYDRLLSSINAINFKTLKELKTEGLAFVWNKINGTFLVALFAGIAVSFVTFSKIFKYLLEHHPHLVWGFFFGLVLGSIYLVSKMVKHWQWQQIVAVILGTAFCFWLTILHPQSSNNQTWYIFICGAIAICAMILPGISGSFILLLLGVYNAMITAVSEMDLTFIATLGLGAIVGLLSFSRFLKWLLDTHYEVTIAVLLGFLIGSLNKIWPWKNTIETFIDRHGVAKPLIEENILPSAYDNPQTLFVVLLVLFGVGLIVLLSKFSPEKDNA